MIAGEHDGPDKAAPRATRPTAHPSTTPRHKAPAPPRRVLLTDELMREVRRLKVRTRRRVDNLLSGEYHSAFRGRGIEFSEVREYEPGDDVRAIDWNVTARSGGGEKAFVKRFVEERQLTVMLVVDQSGSGLFGTVRTSKAQLGCEVAAVLALAATRNSDRIGLTVFSNAVDFYLPPGRGRGQSVRVMTGLLAHEPTRGGTDLAGTLRFLGSVLRRRAIVFVISDFLAEGYEPALRLLAARHQVIAVTVADRGERSSPGVGLVTLIDAESGASRTVDLGGSHAQSRLASAHRERERALDRSFAAAGVDRISASADKPFVPELLKYFRVREHRR